MKRKQKKVLRVLLSIVLCLAALIAVFFLLPRPKSVSDNSFLLGKGERPLLIAHGGGNREFPDNTLEAFYNAYSIDPGCMMETDVNLTSDGVVILSHDTSLDHKSNAKGDIIEWSYEELLARRVDFNYLNSDGALNRYTDYNGNTVTPLDITYPAGVSPRDNEIFLVTTLEELITCFPDNTINVEIKQRGETGEKALDAVIELMARLDGGYNTFGRVVIASFHTNVYDKIKEYQKTYPNLKFSPNESGIILLYATHWFGLDFVYDEPVSVLQIPVSQSGLPLDTRLFISAAHRHNIAVHYWTINDESKMRELAEKGADGIMTDIPSKLKRVLDEMYN